MQRGPRLGAVGGPLTRSAFAGSLPGASTYLWKNLDNVTKSHTFGEISAVQARAVEAGERFECLAAAMSAGVAGRRLAMDAP